MNNKILKSILPEHNFDNTIQSQLEKIIEEQKEAQVEFDFKDRDKLLYELIDTLVATSNVIYKLEYTDKEIDNGFNYVYDKLKSRRYLKDNERNYGI